METVFWIIACHLIGDYVLQTDFLAKTKTENIYHLAIHCLLYSVPFCVCFGYDMRILLIFAFHIWIDNYKCMGAISYVVDQIMHYLIALIYLLPGFWFI